jgi:uncharacterized protein (DUF2249 family)
MSTAWPMDLRALPPPQPLERVVEALDLLQDGRALQILLTCEPHPLYRILTSRGFRYSARWQASDACLVTIEWGPACGAR